MARGQDPIRDRFIHQVGEFVYSLGLNRSVGQLYALLYMSPEALSLDDMAQACGMSKGNASLNVRELERWGAVRKAYVRGDRKDYYEANRDLPEILMERFREGLNRRLGLLVPALEEADKRVAEMDGGGGRKAFYEARLKEVHRFQRSARRLLGNLDTLYKLAKRLM